MKVKVQNLATAEVFEIPDVSKAMLVKKFKTKVKEATGIETKAMNLMFGGKIFNDDCDLCDYKLEDGYKILMQVRKPLEALPSSSNGSTTKASSPEKATLEPEPEKTNAKEVEAKLSREEEKARLIGKYFVLNKYIIFFNITDDSTSAPNRRRLYITIYSFCKATIF